MAYLGPSIVHGRVWINIASPRETGNKAASLKEFWTKTLARRLEAVRRRLECPARVAVTEYFITLSRQLVAHHKS